MINKKNALIPVFFIVILLALPLTLADYSVYLEKGNDNGFSNSIDIAATIEDETYTQIDPTTSAFGTFSDPVVADVNNDGTQDIFIYTGNNIVSILNGDNIEGEQAALEIGEPELNPVICDVDGDGIREYVGVFDNGTGEYLHSIQFYDNTVTVEATYELGNETNFYSKIVCNQFYTPQGDPRHYAIFVDAERYLYISKVDSGSWTNQILDVSGAVNKEDTGRNFLEKHDPAVFTNLDPSGERTIAFVAGNHLITYSSDGDGDSENIDSDFSIAGATGDQRIFVKRVSVAGAEKILVCSGQGSTNYCNKYKITSLLRNINQEGSTLSTPNAAANELIAYSVGNWNGDSTSDVGMITYVPGTQAYVLKVVDAGDFSNFVSIQRTGGTVCSFPDVHNFHFVDFDKDGDDDPVFWCRNTTGNYNVYASMNLLNNTQEVILAEVTGYAGFQHVAPVPVDYNQDGLSDFIIHQTGFTTFLQSSIATVTEQDYPFTVQLDSTTDDLQAVTKITGSYDNEGATYNYALACDTGQDSVFTENFGLQYTFEDKNVSLNIVPPEELLTFEGIVFNIAGNTTQFSLVKDHAVGVRDNLVLTFNFIESGSRTYDVIAFSDASRFTSYWRINKTGTNVSVNKIIPFVGQTHVGSVISGGQVSFEVTYSPNVESFSGIKSFDVNMTINGDVIGDPALSVDQFDGENFQRFELFTDDAGSGTISSLSLKTQNDLTPDFTQFQNGIIDTVGDIIFEIPSPLGSNIPGDGFSVQPDFNEVFYSTCQYDEVGTSTQRHYIGPINNPVDYSNYREVTVDITGVGTDGEFDTEYAILAQDELINTANTYFDDLLGFSSTAARMLVFTLILFFFAYGAFRIHPALGGIVVMIGFVFGAMFGYYPLWVVILLSILAVAAIVFTIRRVFVGE